MTLHWNFVADSPGRLEALSLSQRVAMSDCPVLIVGPTGVGKDVLAEDIHHHSARAKRRFMAINCAAIVTTVFESELFGHSRGAYTSATTDKAGLVEIADRGTLFLDEVGELPLDAQAKLLRFLSKGTFWPVGATKERSADVRVIAATNQDLLPMLDRSFRADLFFRLSVVTIKVPLLEPTDVRRLARTFALEIAAQGRSALAAREVEALAELASSSTYQGGARELRSTIERYFILREARQPIDENWRTALVVGAYKLRPLARDGAAAAGDQSALARCLDDLMFLASARRARSVRELSRRLNRSSQSIYLRLKRFGIKPHELGDDEILDRAMSEARKALSPYRAMIQAMLSDL